MGLKSGGGVLSRWLKGVPPPDWTKRPRAKDELRERAIALRKEGRSYREIRDALGVSKSSLSLWLRDVVLTDEQHERLEALQHQGRTRAARTIQAKRLARRAATIGESRAQITSLAESELFVAGVVAYWCEGTKAKPWRRGERVTFINSDASLITLFIKWLQLIGIGVEDLIFSVSIHESADVARAVRYWASVVGCAPESFRRSVLKRHNPKTVRKNVGDDYYGCLVVTVRRSTELSRKIEGWWLGISTSLGTLAAGQPSGVV